MTGGDKYLKISPAAEYVALLPAAGVGSRLPDRLLSKEMLPFGNAGATGSPVISHLLSCVRQSGIENVIVVLRYGKWDIPDYLAGSEWVDTRFSYKITHGTSGVPETVALGLQDAGSRRVVFGFPDILFEPRDAFVTLIRRLESTKADVVLGLFPTNNPTKMDMVEVHDDGRVISIEIKPETTTLDLTWILAVWKPSFSTYLCDLVHDNLTRIAELATSPHDSHLGHVFQLAMADGLLIDSKSFEHGRSLDIGTPDDLNLAKTWLGQND